MTNVIPNQLTAEPATSASNLTPFSQWPLQAALVQALEKLNIQTPTQVQAAVWNEASAGQDLMVSSQTGSGKTFAFLLPTLNALLNQTANPMQALAGPLVLVVCPTRELAQQVSNDAINLLRNTRGLRVAAVVGGMPYGKQMAALRGATLVVGTPGRLLDLAQQRKLNLSLVQYLIVDEADRMLDMGFSDDLKAIHTHCAKRQQTLMFSATFAKHVVGLAQTMMQNPKRIELAQAHETNADITQQLLWVDNHHHKQQLLQYFLNLPEVEQAVVFTSTQQDAERLSHSLMDDGLNACALHGAMPQTVRNRRLANLRRGDVKILVATDVAARGLDVPTITHVINYGLPMKAEDYVHRIGRTGRAGRTGLAITLAEPSEGTKVKAIERYIQTNITDTIIEGLEPKHAGRHAITKPQGRRNGGGGRGRNGSGGGYGSSNQGFGGAGRYSERHSAEKPSDRQYAGNSQPRGFGQNRGFDNKPASEGRPFSPRGFGESRSFQDNRGFGNGRNSVRNFGEGRRNDQGDRPDARGHSEPRAFQPKQRSAASPNTNPRGGFVRRKAA